ncbi:hypothetical protein [Burkholderia ubonensis]|nr:hypothetical protein [Burkholderia ubonensis]
MRKFQAIAAALMFVGALAVAYGLYRWIESPTPSLGEVLSHRAS